MNANHPAPARDDHATARRGVVAHFVWMLIGPLSISTTAIVMMEHFHGWFSLRSLAYLAALAATIFARWIDPLTDDGKLTTADQRWRTARLTLVAGLIGWTVANLVGKYAPLS